jgi:hypothetical protein
MPVMARVYRISDSRAFAYLHFDWMSVGSPAFLQPHFDPDFPLLDPIFRTLFLNIFAAAFL